MEGLLRRSARTASGTDLNFAANYFFAIHFFASRRWRLQLPRGASPGRAGPDRARREARGRAGKVFLKMHYKSGAGNVVIGLALSSTNFLSPTSEKVLSFLG